MGVGLFLMLKACRVIDSPYDLYWFCLLLSMEIPAWTRLWLYWRAKR